MVAAIGTVCAALAAAFHVYVFVMESVQWTQPRVWKRFGLGTQEQAEITKPLAYNQGFYNLFLALGTVIGLVLLWAGAPGTSPAVAGRTLVLFCLACMAAAAAVLLTTGRRYLVAALLQGLLPLAAFVLLLIG